eukprot:268007_1
MLILMFGFDHNDHVNVWHYWSSDAPKGCTSITIGTQTDYKQRILDFRSFILQTYYEYSNYHRKSLEVLNVRRGENKCNKRVKVGRIGEDMFCVWCKSMGYTVER